MNIELPLDEFRPYLAKGAAKVAREVKIEGFRPGKAPYEVVKQKVGEMTILEEAARLAINETITRAIDEQAGGQPAGEPEISVTKLAPDNPLEYKIALALLPDVRLGEYKNLKIKAEKAVVAEEEIGKMIERLREHRVKESASLSPVKEGDKAIVDIEMFLDNVPLDGGQARDTAVIVGQDYLVKGFDKQLIGLNKNETREFSLPYPADFHDKNLAGKLVSFRAKVKDVFKRELPVADDEFAKGFGVKDLADLKKNIRANIQRERNEEARHKTERRLIEAILAKTRFGDIPEMLVKSEGENMLNELEQGVEAQGGKFEDYLAHLKKTREALLLDLLPEAVKRVKSSLLLRELAKAEKIAVSPEEISRQIKSMKEYYRKAAKDSPEAGEMLKRTDTPEYERYVANILTTRQVINRLREWNVEK